jgi:hypothetical protein
MKRLFAIALVLAGCGGPQAPATPSPATTAQTPRPAAARTAPRDYAQVITREARTDSGLFEVHRVAERLYYEIPDSLLGRDMLLISRMAQAPANLSPFIMAGWSMAEQVVRWERDGDRILLRTVSFQNIAPDSLPISISVQQNNFMPILRTFAVEARNSDRPGVVIDAGPLFEQDIQAISGMTSAMRRQFQVRRLDPARTFIDWVRSYPINVEVAHTLTYDAGEPPTQSGTATISMQMRQSMILLPADPMRIRYQDPRVGWFSLTQNDFGTRTLGVAQRSVIRRWRLEPSDPAAYARGELVDPVKPIVYYLDPATPHEWRPYIRQGVEDWQPAFEAAGFSNAIIARDPPSTEDDPEFDPEDARYSMVRYVATLTRNAVGPSVSDPRSGEILESDILWFHNHLRSYRNRLMLETGAANPGARSLNQDMDLIGETVRQVIAHEIGHALGLPHNMIASSSYPVDSLRSPSFTERMGVAPSVMDYARQNYIAQPGDGVTHFTRKIGPYDHYAINWGYRVFPTTTPESERAPLNAWVRQHADNPMYWYGRQGSGGVDPRSQTEDIGDDAVRASGYGIANLQRVMPNLIEWTTRPGDDYTDLSELYGEMVGQWNRYIGHVVTLVGGVFETLKAADQAGPVYEPVPAARQRAAVQFLVAQVFQTPTWLLDQNILDRIEHSGGLPRMRAVQVGRLNQLLDPQRMQRMVDTEARGPGAYTAAQMMANVQNGVWSELPGSGAIDVFRRALQRGHVERLAWLVANQQNIAGGGFGLSTAVNVPQSDFPALARGQLADLRPLIRARITRTRDTVTRYHLQDVLARIDAALDDNE